MPRGAGCGSRARGGGLVDLPSIRGRAASDRSQPPAHPMSAGFRNTGGPGAPRGALGEARGPSRLAVRGGRRAGAGLAREGKDSSLTAGRPWPAQGVLSGYLVAPPMMSAMLLLADLFRLGALGAGGDRE